jgi:NAD+ synthase (glutamine-hydrolysing)
VRIALAQIDTTVGAFAQTAAAVVERARAAADAGAALVVFPELTLCGYLARDLFEVREFVERADATLRSLAQDPVFERIHALVGFPERHAGPGAGLFNSAALLHAGRVEAVGRKSLLPNYDVFDEVRYFDPAPAVTVVDVAGVRVGISICEDLWNDKQFWRQRRYPHDPIEELVAQGAELIVNLSASPYAVGKKEIRRGMVSAAARRHGVAIALCNLVGGNDAIIFDGRSLIASAAGAVQAEAAAFEEALLIEDVELARAKPQEASLVAGAAASRVAGAAASRVAGAAASSAPAEAPQATRPAPERPAAGASRPSEAQPGARGVDSAYETDLSPGACSDIVAALTLGIRDYGRKTGFKGAVLGLSGGIDSALTAVLAARAFGPGNVTGIAMPSRYTLAMSNDDARVLADRLGLRFETIAIEPMFRAYLDALAEVFAGRKPDVTEENLQARIRGMLLMAFSNKTGALLLSTGNKSELATGFCTLYGDMAGGLAAIGDLSKTAVYAVSRWLNAQGEELIPERILTRPPTAELRENQTDQDTLPPYDELDRVLRGHIEEHLGRDELIARGMPEATVRRVLKLVVNSEYKRRQAAPTLRVSGRAFGEGWRFPIAHAYRY